MLFSISNFRSSQFHSLKYSEVTHLLCKSIIFLGLLVILSFMISTLFGWIGENGLVGYYGFRRIVRTKPQIVIIGASRAKDHYVPEVISQLTGKRTYNFGTFGSNVLVQYSQLVEIVKVYKPDLIIYEVSGFDLAQGYMQMNLDHLKLYPNNKYTAEARHQYDEFSGLRLVFPLYKFNQISTQVLSASINSRSKVDEHFGYHPLYEALLPKKIERGEKINDSTEGFYGKSELLAEVFSETLKLIQAEKLNVVFTHSPYYVCSGLDYPPADHGVIDAINQQNLRFYDFADLGNPEFQDPRNYYDYVHLTDKAARIYSRLILPFIQESLQ